VFGSCRGIRQQTKSVTVNHLEPAVEEPDRDSFRYWSQKHVEEGVAAGTVVQVFYIIVFGTVYTLHQGWATGGHRATCGLCLFFSGPFDA